MGAVQIRDNSYCSQPHTSGITSQAKIARVIRPWHLVPAPLLVLLSIVSMQLGAASAKMLLVSYPAITVLGLRSAMAAGMLWLVARPAMREYSRRQWFYALLQGVLTSGMILLFYSTIARLPLGIGMTITFLGPFAVSLLTSRTLIDIVWPVIALGGVALFAPAGGDGSLSTPGLLFGFGAAVAWGTYPLLTARTSSMFPGTTGLTLATTFGALITLPMGVAFAGHVPLSLSLLGRGFLVAILATFIPFSLEFLALKRMSPRVFGILVSGDPAVAALMGYAVLHEHLRGRDWLGLILVTLAAIGALAKRKDKNKVDEVSIEPSQDRVTVSA